MIKDGIKDQQLHQPLDPEKDYYDATPSIEECAKLVAVMQERVDRMEIALETQGSINQNLINVIHAIGTRLELLEGNGQKPSALILPPRLDS